MKMILQMMKSSLTLLLFGISTSIGFAQGGSPEVIQGKVHVKFKETLSSALSSMNVRSENGMAVTGIASFDAVASQYQASEIKPLFIARPGREEAHRKHGLHLWYEVTISKSQSVLSSVQSFKSLGEVDMAEPIYAKALVGNPTFERVELPRSTNGVNDPGFSKQWHYENDGSNNGIVEGDINLLEAWETTAGTSNVIVAVIDEGVDVDHEDLAANMWVNLAEKNGQPGVDDDFNGFIDDVHGYDFINLTGNIQAGSHGTHVAGTVAAVNNNGIGVAGVAGGTGNGDGARIMSLRAVGGLANIAATYVYAADNGAVIAQNSWSYISIGYYEQAVLDAIDYFIEEAGYYNGSPMKGGIVIFAASNDNYDQPIYPAYYERTMAVSALSRANTKASYSNFGSWVDIAAPGGDMSPTYGSGGSGGVFSTIIDGYAFYQGTSMACPHVSGIAALVVSARGGENFTNEDLWTHLMTGTYDVDQYNPNYVGKLGVGYIDAALALVPNTGVGPNQVTDLAVTGSAQDFVDLNWTAISDPDDGTVFGYEIYYSTDETKVANRTSAYATFNNKDAAGATLSFTIENLSPETQYYFAITAFDRFKNRGALSDVVSGTTTDAPEIAFSATTKTLNINVATNTQGTDAFDVINNSNGALKWRTEVRPTKNYTLNTTGIEMPQGGVAKGYNLGSLTIAESENPIGTDDYNNEFVNKSWREGKDFSPLVIIGDEDLTLTNSMAQRYTVTDPDGFNLTYMLQYMRLNRNVFPNGVLQIYAGEEMLRKNLVHVQNFDGLSSDTDGYEAITMLPFINFEYGETFWVVMHMPAGILYPLGIGLEETEDQSDNSFYSNDGGETWVLLENVFGQGQWVWRTELQSKQQAIHEYMTLSPDQGVTAGNSSETISVDVDASGLINGKYYASTVFYSNDDSNPAAKVDFTINVTGHQPVLSSEELVDLGSTFVGVSRTITIPMNNSGYGVFRFNKASCSSTTTSVNFGTSNTGIPTRVDALSDAELVLTFTPETAGNISGLITLVDYNGNTHEINVSGVGIDPAGIALSEVSSDYTMSIGDVQQGTFDITNTGNYPLSYYFPKYVEKENVVLTPSNINPYGYTWGTSTADGVPYIWDDISATGTRITDHFRANNTFYEADLGFAFPYFGEEFEKMYLTVFGIITTHNQTGVVGNTIDPFNPTQNNQISALNKRAYLETSGEVYVQRKSGKLIVQFEDVQISSSGTRKLTYQMVLHQSGDINFYYKGYVGLSGTLLVPQIAASEGTKKLGFIAYDGTSSTPLVPQFTIAANSAVAIYSPGVQAIENLSRKSGIVPVGGSHTITYDVNSTNLNEGVQYQRLNIASNDPLNPYTTYTANIDVNGGGMEDVQLESASIDLGSIFQGDSKGSDVIVRNFGNKGVNITDITLDNGYFTLDYEALPVDLKAKSSFSMAFTHDGVDLGIYSDVLNITLSNGEILHVDLTIEVTVAPGALLTFDPINYTQDISAGTVDTHIITLENNGGAELEYTFSAGVDWAYESSSSMGDADYMVRRSDEVGGPSYLWRELVGDAEAEQLDNGTIPIWHTKELPFPFTFYGNTYTTVYINANGVLTFDGTDLPDFPQIEVPQGQMGDPNWVNNAIAPYWGRGAYFHALPYEQTGAFYKEFDDHVVIEFANFYNVTNFGDPISIQAILYSNGNIKFQYKHRSVATRSFFGVVGIENEDASKGKTVFNFSETVPDLLSVVFTPANTQALAAGESKDISVTIDSAPLKAGVYNTNFIMQTNVPGQKTIEIPATLTAIGVSEPYVADVNLGDVLAKELPNGDVETFDFNFYLTNNGSADINFSTADFEIGTNYINGFIVYGQLCSRGFCTPTGDNIGGAIALTLAPGSSYEIRMTFDPVELAAFEAMDELVFDRGLETEFRVPLYANVYLPSVLSIEKTSYHFDAPTTGYTGSDVITFDNSTGQAALEYTIDVTYDRSAGQTSAARIVDSNIGVLQANPVKPASVTALASTEAFNRELSYGMDEVDTYVGFGASSAFTAATRFRADIDGFNLTHAATYYSTEGSTSPRLAVDIYAGEDIANAKLVSSSDSTLALANGFKGWVSIELDEAFPAAPFEYFWIVYKYPVGPAYPQAVNEAGSYSDTFMYPSEGQWYDVQDINGFSTTGFMMRAQEAQVAQTGWIHFDALSGTVPAGEMGTLNFNVFAANVVDPLVKANIQVISNDPYNTDETVTVTMSLNVAPVFYSMISTYEVNELETLNFEASAYDFEDEVFTFSLVDAPVNMSLIQSGNTAMISYRPYYNASGTYVVGILVTDATGNTTRKDVTIVVNDTYVLGTDELENQAYNVYPNPTTSELKIQLPNTGSYIFKVYDLSGKAVIEATSERANELEMNVSDLEKGLYIMEVFNGKKVQSVKFIKQ